jgi:hypothetical protein
MEFLLPFLLIKNDQKNLSKSKKTPSSKLELLYSCNKKKKTCPKNALISTLSKLLIYEVL